MFKLTPLAYFSCNQNKSDRNQKKKYIYIYIYIHSLENQVIIATIFYVPMTKRRKELV